MGEVCLMSDESNEGSEGNKGNEARGFRTFLGRFRRRTR